VRPRPRPATGNTRPPTSAPRPSPTNPPLSVSWRLLRAHAGTAAHRRAAAGEQEAGASERVRDAGGLCWVIAPKIIAGERPRIDSVLECWQHHLCQRFLQPGECGVDAGHRQANLVLLALVRRALLGGEGVDLFGIGVGADPEAFGDRKSTRLNSSHVSISD